MPQLDVLASSFSSGFGSALSQTMQWFGYFLIALLIIGFIFVIYLFTQYKYKAEIYIQRNVGDTGTGITVGKIKKTLIRKIYKDGVHKFKILFVKQPIQPIPDKYIMPGNNVKLFKMGDSYIPGLIKVGNPEFAIESTPQAVKFWAMNERRAATQEYQDLKSKLMPMVYGMGIVLLALIFAGVVFYFTYQHSNQVVTALNSINLDVAKTNWAQQAATNFVP